MDDSLTPSLRIDAETTHELPVASLVRHPEVEPDGAAVVGRRGDALAVRHVLATDRPWVTVVSIDDDYRASIPTDELMAGGLILIGTTDQPLSEAEGGPLRLVVAEGSTLCWNVKQVASLIATEEPLPDSVPENPTH